MSSQRETLFAYLADLGIASVTTAHEPVFTVEQSHGLRATLPGAHTKNLFLVDKSGACVLVVARDETRVELKKVAAELRLGRLSFGKPELLAERLGVTPGSVTPFALINDPEGKVTAVLDAALLGFAEVNCHPLENTATTRLATADLLRFIEATGHNPVIVGFGRAAAGD